MTTRRLHLHLKHEYFAQIKAGTKIEEFRAYTNFYARQLANAPFSEIVLYDGYPKAGDTARIMTRPWRGFTDRMLTHPHFGPKPVRVYAISVN